MRLRRSALRAMAAASALFLTTPRSLAAQGTAVIPAGDAAYADLDWLNAHGLLDSVIVGQRPYSGREFARLVAIARRHAAASSRGLAEDSLSAAVLRRLDRRLEIATTPFQPVVSLLDEVSLSATSTNARRRPFLSDPQRPAETTIDPLADRRLGEVVARGRTATLEVAQRAEPTGWLALFARERIEARDSRVAGVAAQYAELLRGGLRARFRNTALTVGREQTTWAQRDGDGFFLASDAPALDQVSLASDRPFTLPGFLRRAGLVSATLNVADLGTSVVRPHSKLLSYKVSVAPTPSLELGGMFQNHFGGSGSRPSSALNRFIDFVPLLDLFRKHNYTDSTSELDPDSDKRIGADARLTLPRLGGMVIAGEWQLDDFDATRPEALITNDASEAIAVLLPRLGTPALSLELSAKKMGIYASTHAELVNGMTTRGRLLGDELGNDAKAFGATLHWRPTPSARVTLDGRSAIYSDVVYYGNEYMGQGWKVFKLSSQPDELRDRLIATVLIQPESGLDLWARAGGERIRNARYYGARRSYVAEVGVRLRGVLRGR